MSSVRWFAVAVSATALGSAGCKKDQPQQPSQPVATAPVVPEPAAAPAVREETPPASDNQAGVGTPVTSTTPANVAARAEGGDILGELDRSIGKFAGGLALPGMGGKIEEGSASGSGRAEGERDTPPPIRRMQFQVDVSALKELPLWSMVRMGILAYRSQMGDEGNQACVFDMLDQLTSAYFDVTIGAGGDPAGVVVALGLGGGAVSLSDCIRRNLEEGQSMGEAQVGGRPGFLFSGPAMAESPFPVVMVEASAGNWVLGSQPEVEQFVASGARAEGEGTFRTLTGPLGPADARMTVIPTSDLAAMASAAEPPPAELACVVPLVQRLRGASAGVKVTGGLGLAIALQTGSAAEAAESQGCLQGIWNVAKPKLLAEMGQEEAAQFQALVGVSLAQVLDTVRIESTADFAKVSLSLPADALDNIMQGMAALAGAGAAGRGPAGAGTGPIPAP